MSIKKKIIENDLKIMDMAFYCESKGMTTSLPPSPDQLLMRFKEFKSLLKREEFSMEELENKVYSSYGVIMGETKTPKTKLSNISTSCTS